MLHLSPLYSVETSNYIWYRDTPFKSMTKELLTSCNKPQLFHIPVKQCYKCVRTLKLCALKLWAQRWQELGKLLTHTMSNFTHIVTHCHTHCLTLHTTLFFFNWLHQRKRLTSGSHLWFICDGSAFSDIFFIYLPTSSLPKSFLTVNWPHWPNWPLQCFACQAFCHTCLGVFIRVGATTRFTVLFPIDIQFIWTFWCAHGYMIRMIERSPAVIVLSHQT